VALGVHELARLALQADGRPPEAEAAIAFARRRGRLFAQERITTRDDRGQDNGKQGNWEKSLQRRCPDLCLLSCRRELAWRRPGHRSNV
jgi:hypothetical protein